MPFSFSVGRCLNCGKPIRPMSDVKTRMEQAGHSKKQREICGKMLLQKMMEIVKV